MGTSDGLGLTHDSLDRQQNRIASRHPFQLIAGLREQLGAGKHLLLASLYPRPRAMNTSLTAGARQLTEKCEANTLPATVPAANPQAVSSSAPIRSACKKPAYCAMSVS